MLRRKECLQLSYVHLLLQFYLFFLSFIKLHYLHALLLHQTTFFNVELFFCLHTCNLNLLIHIDSIYQDKFILKQKLNSIKGQPHFNPKLLTSPRIHYRSSHLAIYTTSRFTTPDKIASHNPVYIGKMTYLSIYFFRFFIGFLVNKSHHMLNL